MHFTTAYRRTNKSSCSRPNKRRLLVEQLERRNLLAAAQNQILPHDVNEDGLVTPIDALNVINYLHSQTNGGSSRPPREDYFYDVSGNGSVSPTDALQVINLLARDIAAPQIEVQLTQDTGGSEEQHEDLLTFNPEIKIHTSDATGIQQLEVSLNGEVLAPVPHNKYSPTFFLPDLAVDGSADGTHLVEVRARDSVGNWSESVDLTFTLDTVPPAVDSFNVEGYRDFHVSFEEPVFKGVNALQQASLTDLVLNQSIELANIRVLQSAANQAVFEVAGDLQNSSGSLHMWPGVFADAAGNTNTGQTLTALSDPDLEIVELPLGMNTHKIRSRIGPPEGLGHNRVMSRIAFDAPARIVVDLQAESADSSELRLFRDHDSDGLAEPEFERLDHKFGQKELELSEVVAAGQYFVEVGLSPEPYDLVNYVLDITTEAVEVDYVQYKADGIDYELASVGEVPIHETGVDGSGHAFEYFLTEEGDVLMNAFGVGELSSDIVFQQRLDGNGQLTTYASDGETHVFARPPGVDGSTEMVVENNDPDGSGQPGFDRFEIRFSDLDGDSNGGSSGTQMETTGLTGSQAEFLQRETLFQDGSRTRTFSSPGDRREITTHAFDRDGFLKVVESTSPSEWTYSEYAYDEDGRLTSAESGMDRDDASGNFEQLTHTSWTSDGTAFSKEIRGYFDGGQEALTYRDGELMRIEYWAPSGTFRVTEISGDLDESPDWLQWTEETSYYENQGGTLQLNRVIEKLKPTILPTVYEYTKRETVYREDGTYVRRFYNDASQLTQQNEHETNGDFLRRTVYLDTGEVSHYEFENGSTARLTNISPGDSSSVFRQTYGGAGFTPTLDELFGFDESGRQAYFRKSYTSANGVSRKLEELFIEGQFKQATELIGGQNFETRVIERSDGRTFIVRKSEQLEAKDDAYYTEVVEGDKVYKKFYTESEFFAIAGGLYDVHEEWYENGELTTAIATKIVYDRDDADNDGNFFEEVPISYGPSSGLSLTSYKDYLDSIQPPDNADDLIDRGKRIFRRIKDLGAPIEEAVRDIQDIVQDPLEVARRIADRASRFYSDLADDLSSHLNNLGIPSLGSFRDISIPSMSELESDIFGFVEDIFQIDQNEIVGILSPEFDVFTGEIEFELPSVDVGQLISLPTLGDFNNSLMEDADLKWNASVTPVGDLWQSVGSIGGVLGEVLTDLEESPYVLLPSVLPLYVGRELIDQLGVIPSGEGNLPTIPEKGLPTKPDSLEPPVLDPTCVWPECTTSSDFEFVLDYSYDEGDFLPGVTGDAKAAIAAAARTLSILITSQLKSVAHDVIDYELCKIESKEQDCTTSFQLIEELLVGRNEMVVLVGAGTTTGTKNAWAGTMGYQHEGARGVFNSIMNRGAGFSRSTWSGDAEWKLFSPPGYMSFNQNPLTPFYAGLEESLIGAEGPRSDLYSTALHELIHVLGALHGIDAWDRLDIPKDGEGHPLDDGTTSVSWKDGSEQLPVIMTGKDNNLRYHITDLDVEILKALGWDIPDKSDLVHHVSSADISWLRNTLGWDI